jgi:hypothetical protein
MRAAPALIIFIGCRVFCGDFLGLVGGLLAMIVGFASASIDNDGCDFWLRRFS